MCKKVFLLTVITLLLAFAGSASADVPADANMLIHYEFENDATNSGTLGTAGDGTEVSFSTADHYPSGGKFGDAFELLDTVQSGSYPDTITVGYADSIADMTFAFWYKRPDASATSYSYLHHGSLRMNFESNNDGSSLKLFVGNPTVYSTEWSDTIATGTWVHLAAVCADNGDGTVSPTFYLNGVAVSSSDTDTPGNDGMTMRLGWGTSNAGWLIDDYRIYDYALPAADVNDLYGYSPGFSASDPSPAIATTAIDTEGDLSWTEGLYCQDTNAHEIYFGTSYTAVRDATTASGEFKGRQNLGSATYDPGTLTDGTNYYWRIDEVNDSEGGSPWTGDVWSFRTWGMTYYVSTSGSDSADGSIGSPWKTAYYAAGNCARGDTVYFRAGTFRETREVTNFPTDADANSRVTFKAYPSETAIISCMQLADSPGDWTLVTGNIYKMTLSAYLGSGGISPAYIPNISEDGIPLLAMPGYATSGDETDLTGAGQFSRDTSDPDNPVLYVWAFDGANPGTHTTEYSWFPYNGSHTIVLHNIYTRDYIGFEDLTIEGGYYPIITSRHYTEMKNCIFRNCYGDGIKGNGGEPNDYNFPGGPEHWAGDYGLIENCEVYDFYESGIDITGGDYWVIRNTYVHSPVQGEATAVMTKNHSIGTLIEGCEFVKCGVTIGGVSFTGIADEAVDVVMKNNIIRDIPGTRQNAVLFQGAKNCSFVNNLIVDCNFSSEIMRFNSADVTKPKWNNRDCTITNNIYHNISGNGYVYWDSPVDCMSDNLVSNNNVTDANMLYYWDDNHYTLAQFQSLGYEANSITTAATFVDIDANDFRPLSGSVQVNAGTPYAVVDSNKYDPYRAGETDYDGNVRVHTDVNIVDIGPFEFSTDAASNPNPSHNDTKVLLDAILSWSPLDSAADTNGHDVYFGTNYSDVATATTSDPVYMGRQDSNSYDPLGGSDMSSGTTYYWAIDEVNGVTIWPGDIWEFATIGATSKVTTPSPADAATGVSAAADISWAADPEAQNYNVYFGTASPGTLQGNQTALSFDPGTLDYNTPYYWRIDSNNVLGSTTGDVWSFTTAGDYSGFLSTHYKFDESSGYTAADSAGTDDITLHTNFDEPGCWISTKFDNGILCDGTNDWAYIPDAVGTDFHDKTISMWVKTPSTFGSGGYLTHATSDYRMNIEFYSTGLKAVVGPGTAWASTAMTPSTDTWYHIVLVVEDSGANVAPTFYIDGSAQSDNDVTPAQHSGTLGNWTFASYSQGGSEYFKGTVGDFRIYDAALSASDVNDLYQSDPDTLFTDSFENGEWDSKWTEDAQLDWFDSSTESRVGSMSASVDGGATDANISSIAIDVSSYSDVNVIFDWWIDGNLDASEYLKFDIKLDSGSWENQLSLDGDVDVEDQWHSENVAIDVSSASNLYLRFRGTMSAANEDAYVDNVEVFNIIAGAAATAPTVTNSAATNITYSSATLNGEVTDTGGEDPTVTIYWGDNDGGTTPGNWDNSINKGTQSSTYSSGITSLNASTTYYFRSYATNSGGNDWADSTANFTTSSVTAPTVTNSAATNVTSSAARLNGEVTDTGGENPTVTIYWGDNDGGTTPGNWDNSEAMSTQSGTYFKDISSLSGSTTYYFRSYASNSGGNDWANSTLNFTTDVAPLFTDGFESGDFSTGGWSTQNGDASVSNQADYTGTYGAKLKKTTWIEKAVSTSGYTDIHVEYARKTTAFDSGEYLYVEWYDGSSWTELESTQGTSWIEQDQTCGAGANNNASFKIRFRTNAGANNESAYVDDVQVSGTAQ